MTCDSISFMKEAKNQVIVLQLTNEEVDLLLMGLQYLLLIRANFCEPTKRKEISIEQISDSIKMQTGKPLRAEI